MQIYINGEKREVIGFNLSEILTALGMSRPGIAVAVNDEVVHREDWKQRTLKEKDSVLIITATQGG